MKYLLFLVGLLSLCFGDTVVYEKGQPGGVILHQGNAESKSPWQDTWQSKIVAYPPVGEYPVKIGYIRIINNLDSSYSTVTIRKGGIGSKNVSMEFYAPAYRGYDYRVLIRAVPLV